MVPEINYIAVVLATLSSMVVGSIWYTPKVFGRRWMKLSGMTPEDTQTGFVKALVITLLVSFVTALVLAGTATIVHDYYGGGNFLLDTVITAVVLWAGFTAARFTTHDLFDRRPAGLTVLNIAHELVTLVVMALIIGVWPV
ncbi:DUF1761 domain-containing protein [uncultured Schumannella sp.]|uniref:DUF1761 domain-containing protein n=1 Tax=uncultured Schumannella sp. TaxID=1195956 RepID=UPI0025E3582B|nr:DUF1761 domain-containing protein [uncultured Schumannella sp.]